MIKLDEINYVKKDMYCWTLYYHTKNEKYGQALPNGKVSNNEYSIHQTYHGSLEQALHRYVDYKLGEVSGTILDVLNEFQKLTDAIKSLTQVSTKIDDFLEEE